MGSFEACLRLIAGAKQSGAKYLCAEKDMGKHTCKMVMIADGKTCKSYKFYSDDDRGNHANEEVIDSNFSDAGFEVLKQLAHDYWDRVVDCNDIQYVCDKNKTIITGPIKKER